MTDNYGLSERSVYDRVVANLSHLIEVGSLEFRFFRGGSFRASVIREQITSVLSKVEAEKDQFNRALSEVVSYANALVFSTERELIDNPTAIAPVESNIPADALPVLRGEVENRIAILKRTVDLSDIASRAKLRRYSTAATINEITWSISRGTLVSNDNDQSSFESVGLNLSLFQPTGGQGRNYESSIFADFFSPPNVISFLADRRDIDNLIEMLTKIRQEMKSA
jgi:hypothetical protein